MPTLLLSLLLSTLGNADVVKLVKAGLSAETIEAKIASSDANFDTSTDALVALANDGVPDRVIRAMIGAKPKPEPAAVQTAAPARRATNAARRGFTSRRYGVTFLGANGGKCEGELRVDGNGIQASRCGALDFELPWSAITTACYDYSFRGTVVIEGHRIATITPAEAKRIVDHIRGKVAVAGCNAR
jgi:hypothetical protein